MWSYVRVITRGWHLFYQRVVLCVYGGGGGVQWAEMFTKLQHGSVTACFSVPAFRGWQGCVSLCLHVGGRGLCIVGADTGEQVVSRWRGNHHHHGAGWTTQLPAPPSHCRPQISVTGLWTDAFITFKNLTKLCWCLNLTNSIFFNSCYPCVYNCKCASVCDTLVMITCFEPKMHTQDMQNVHKSRLLRKWNPMWSLTEGEN